MDNIIKFPSQEELEFQRSIDFTNSLTETQLQAYTQILDSIDDEFQELQNKYNNLKKENQKLKNIIKQLKGSKNNESTTN